MSTIVRHGARPILGGIPRIAADPYASLHALPESNPQPNVTIISGDCSGIVLGQLEAIARD
jgi:hypothetical protein